MRTYTIMSGKYTGAYKIYDTEEEFHKNEPYASLKIWGAENDIEIGDWVRANDGYVLQVLGRTELKDMPKRNNGRLTYIYHFPTGAYYKKTYNNQPAKYQILNAWYTVDRQNVSNKRKPYRRMFMLNLVALLKSNPNMSIYDAYDSLEKKPQYKKNRLSIISELMMNENVQEVMAERYDRFKELLLNDDEFSDESMLEYIKDFKRHVRKGSLVHLQSIFQLLQLLGKIPTEDKKKLSSIQEVPYEEVQPPKLSY